MVNETPGRRLKRQAVLVLGMHRSGTSALSRVVNLLGATAPKTPMPANENNPRGYWESDPLFQLHEEMLNSLGSSWHDWRALDPLWFGSSIAQQFKRRIKEILSSEYDAASLIVVKDPRICRMLNFWRELLHELKITPIAFLQIRNPLEVAASLQHRDALSVQRSLLLWLRHTLDAEYHSRAMPRCVVEFESLLADWRPTMVHAAAQSGMTWPVPYNEASGSIASFLSHELRHEQWKAADLRSHPEVVRWVEKTYAAMRQLCRDGDKPSLLENLDDVRSQFETGCAAFGAVLREGELELEKTRGEATRLAGALEQTKEELRHSAKTLEIANANLTNSGAELEALRSATTVRDAKLAEATGRMQHLLNELQQRDAQITSLTTENQRLAGDLRREERRASSLAAQINAIEGINRQLRAELDTQNALAAQFNREIAQLRSQLATLRSELQHAREQLALRSAQVTSNEREMQRLAASFAEQSHSQSEREAALSNELTRVQLVLRAIENSRSWRIMEPLRATSRGIRQSQPGYTLAVAWRAIRQRSTSPIHEWRVVQRIRQTDSFDADWYLKAHPDVAEGGFHPIQHYVQFGAAEGRRPSAALVKIDYDLDNLELDPAPIKLARFLKQTLERASNMRRNARLQSPARPDEAIQAQHSSQGRPAPLQAKHAADNLPSPDYLLLHPDLQTSSRPSLNVAVSVVIPTYNAGSEFYWLLHKLRQQKGLRSIQIVVVDSGSTDGTDRVAQELACDVVRISKQQFSHSFSRNTGAEHATGDYLLFMVQDAFPVGDHWIQGLVTGLLQAHDGAYLSALSCTEYSRIDSELLYDLLIDSHYKFLGCRDRDRIGMMQGDDHLELRRQGQLSDVACLIPKTLFERYKYQGRYAEDLTLGVRLIRDGHKIAMISSIPVIHSHRRPANYYLRRSFVDVVFLVEIFPDFTVPTLLSVRGTLAAARAIGAHLPKLQPSAQTKPSAALATIIDALKNYKFDNTLLIGIDGLTFGYSPFDDWVNRISASAAPCQTSSLSQSALHFKAMLLNRLIDMQAYLEIGYPALDEKVAAEINDAVEKSIAMALGAQLAFHSLMAKSGVSLDIAPKLIVELHTLLIDGI